jgi:hypothetical protein
MTSIFFLQLNTCSYSPYVTSSQMTGWVCHLQLLLALARAVILKSRSCKTHDYTLMSQIRDSPQPGGARSPYLYPPRTGWSSYTPKYWVHFSSPSMTHRAMVEVLKQTSRRNNSNSQLALLTTSRHRLQRKHRLSVAVNCCCGNMLVCRAVT